jgi:tetratricopeptide (TPR) repeat protein
LSQTLPTRQFPPQAESEAGRESEPQRESEPRPSGSGYNRPPTPTLRLLLSTILLLTFAAPARPTSPAFEQALAAVQAGNHSAALGYFEQAIREDSASLRYASEYRQAVIRAEAYDRCIAFFEKLAAANPNSANAWLNYGFAYVDKIPAAGSITQVILANTAQGFFGRSIEVEKTWLGLYSRGNSQLYWPKVFGRALLGVADLEEAYKIQKKSPQKLPVYVRVYVALGDGYWKTDQIEKSRAIWREGLQEFPGNQALTDRLSREGEELETYIENNLDPNKRVDTDLKPLWSAEEGAQN